MKKNLKPLDRYYWLEIEFILPMIDTFGKKSNIFNLWVDTLSIKDDQ
jgi:hypothetical protein